MKTCHDIPSAVYVKIEEKSHRLKRFVNSLCTSIVGCLIQLDNFFPTRWFLEINEAINHALGLRGPTELLEKQLELAKIEHEIQTQLLTEAKLQRHHFSKKMMMRLQLYNIKRLKVFKELCELFDKLK